MSEVTKRPDDIQKKKERIRKRYAGVDMDSIHVIPARVDVDIFEDDGPKRVAVYARVSTDSVNQTSSYELQKNYYEDLVKRHPNWTLVNIYADEGISGTSLNHREAFRQMIRDCEQGMIDLVITKSVSRFARNVEDCIHYSRRLKSLKVQVGILFETEGIYTLKNNSEMQLAFLATLAQEESHTKSESMNRSIEMRFERGIFLTPVLLGYDHDEDGELIVNREEAYTVRLIFLMYLYGYSCTEIADRLTAYKRVTKLGNDVWSTGSVYGILRNERYCGDVLAHKTYTPDYLTHKSVKNVFNRPQYHVENHHEAIVSREDYVVVQKLMDQRKYGFRKALPELKVIDGGVLKGFVQINPNWVGFSEEDYLDACHSVLEDADYLNPCIRIREEKGTFDYRDYQVTRIQFVPTTRKISVSLSKECIKFSSYAVNELKDVLYVEILYHPLYQLLVVRKTEKHNRHAVKWAEFTGEKYRARHIRGYAFLPILYSLCDWNEEYKYTLTGYAKEKDGEKVLMFYVDEPEIRRSEDGYRKTVYPMKWKDRFGDEFHEHVAKTISIFSGEKEWDLYRPGVIANVPDFTIRNEAELQQEIAEIEAYFENQIKEWNDGRQESETD